MNIAEAKQQVINAMRVYFSKDEQDDYRLATEKQRPVFLIGAPGIGKTAIMEQIAQELKVGFVSYSMTHHTRQSALGLPFIAKKTYGGVEYDVSEYTMSEIIASVYDAIESTGREEGILFLDEINCVSETLTPAMLQFLQYKTFGRHKVPAGWIVVTAGNPSEYNRTARDFDIATWDRLKRIDVEPDYDAWRRYAVSRGVHPAVLTYLDIKPDQFYHIERSVDRTSFVTARGWDDLSSMMKLCEEQAIRVDEALVGQYVQDDHIAKQFAVYADLFEKYRRDYHVDGILDGTCGEDIFERATNAAFDERIALVGLISDALGECLRKVMWEDDAVKGIHENLLKLKQQVDGAGSLRSVAMELIADLQQDRQMKQAAGLMSKREAFATRRAIDFLTQIAEDDMQSFDEVKKRFAALTAALDDAAHSGSLKMDHALGFVERACGRNTELLLLVTDIATNRCATEFIDTYGNDAYLAACDGLDFDASDPLVDAIGAAGWLNRADKASWRKHRVK